MVYSPNYDGPLAWICGVGSVVGPVHDGFFHDGVHDCVHGLVLELFWSYPDVLEEIPFISGWIARRNQRCMTRLSSFVQTF
jgi:hypothetical protein